MIIFFGVNVLLYFASNCTTCYIQTKTVIFKYKQKLFATTELFGNGNQACWHKKVKPGNHCSWSYTFQRSTRFQISRKPHRKIFLFPLNVGGFCHGTTKQPFVCELSDRVTSIRYKEHSAGWISSHLTLRFWGKALAVVCAAVIKYLCKSG